MKFNLINYFLHIFIKKDRKTKIINEVNLDRWNKLLTLNNTWINTIISINSIENIGKALIHSDKDVQEIFINSAKNSGFEKEAQQIRNYILNNPNISKLNSDRMKAIVANSFTEKKHLLYKDLLPPGWI